MRNNSKTAARTKAQTPDIGFSAKISTKAMETIQDLSSRHHISPAAAGGALLAIGADLLGMEGRAEMVGKSYETMVLTLVRRTLPAPRHVITVISEEYPYNIAQSWKKDLNRPIEEILGQMIDIAVPYCNHAELLSRVAPDRSAMFYKAWAFELLEDFQHNPDALKLLKAEPVPPYAFSAFEAHLDNEKGTA